jgi:type IV pilus assembly protein PilM
VQLTVEQRIVDDVIELGERQDQRHQVGVKRTAFAQVALPRDAISEGSIKEPGLVSDAVKECVQKAGVKGSAAVISVSGREAIVKRVPLPKVTAWELADAIPLEAEHHIPFAVDDVFLDYQVVGESVNSMSVVLVAVKKVKVLEYVAVVEQAGLEALVVDLDAYELLARQKRAGQSFSQVIKAHFGRQPTTRT